MLVAFVLVPLVASCAGGGAQPNEVLSPRSAAATAGGSGEPGSTSPSATSNSIVATPTEQCPGATTYDLAMCGLRLLEVADQELARIFDAVRVGADDRDREMLDDTQARWVADRERFCVAIGARAGTVQALNVLSCKLDMAKHRTAELCNWDTSIPEEQPTPCRSRR